MKNNRNTLKITYIIILTLSLLGGTLYAVSAAESDLDPSFDSDGIVTTDLFSGSGDFAKGITVQPDGKIVVGGSSGIGVDGRAVLVRYNSDGSLDDSFGVGGIVPFPEDDDENGITGVTMDDEGRIVVVGYLKNTSGDYDIGIARFLSNGFIDPSFADEGKLSIDFTGDDERGVDIIVQSDGKILVMANSFDGVFYTIALIRLNVDGTFDTGFDTDGIVEFPNEDETQATAMAVDGDGRIIITGLVYRSSVDDDIGVACFLSDGSFDPSFEGGGKMLIDFSGADEMSMDISVQSDGKIVVAGDTDFNSEDDFVLVRLNADGSFDDDFGTGGTVIADLGYNEEAVSAMALQDDGKILVAGYAHNGSNEDIILARFNSDGSLDSEFGSGGVVTTDVGGDNDEGLDMALQSDGKILVAGFTDTGSSLDIVVLRFLSGQSMMNYIPIVLLE
jgi:uncharacterized delta-60 repeat protein